MLVGGYERIGLICCLHRQGGKTNLQMGTGGSSKTVTTYDTSRYHNTEDHTLNLDSRVNVRSLIHRNHGDGLRSSLSLSVSVRMK
jgi:hypothetical protein